jgi:hypothetical protein
MIVYPLDLVQRQNIFTYTADGKETETYFQVSVDNICPCWEGILEVTIGLILLFSGAQIV